MSMATIQAVRAEAEAQGLDPDFATAIAHQESGFNQKAVSPRGAVGVMQLMPKTAADLGVDPTDEAQNIKGGVAYLKQLATRYNGDPQLTAAAYNAGPSAVDHHGGVPPYKETQAYVKAVTGAAPAAQTKPAGPRPDIGESDSELMGNAGIPQSQAMPSPSEVMASIQKSSAAPPPSASAAPVQGAQGAPPSPEEVMKVIGDRDFQGADGQPVSASRQKANDIARAGVENLNPWARGAYGVASNALLGSGPIISGALKAGENLVSNATGHPTGMNSGDVFRAEMEARQKDQDSQSLPLKLLEGVAGAVAGGGGGLVHAGENVGQGVLAHFAPELATKVVGGKVAPSLLGKVAGGAAVGGLYGGVEAAEGGQDPLGTLGAAAGSAALGGGLTGAVEGVAAPLIKMGVEAVSPAAVKNAAASERALELINQKAPDAAKTLRESAAETPGMIAGEALPQGKALLQTAADAAPDSVAPVKNAVLERNGGLDARLAGAAEEATGVHPENAELEAQRAIQEAAEGPMGTEAQAARQKEALDPAKVQERLSEGLQRETGIDPQTANASTDDIVKAMREGPAKQAYEEALPGNGVWNENLAELSAEPEIKAAMNKARRLMGSDALVPNPERAPPAPSPASPPKVSGPPPGTTPQESMSAADYQKLMRGDDLEGFIREGAEPSGGAAPAPEKPTHIPTDRFWDLTKKMLDKSLTRDAFGRAEGTSENYLRQEMSGRLRDALDQAIPGYKDARKIAGDYLEVRQAHENAPALGRAGEDAASFQGRWSKMSEGARDATQRGIMGKLYMALDAAKTGGKFVLSPRDQRILRMAFGDARGSRIAALFEREAELARAKPSEGLEKVLERRYREGRQLANGTSSAPSPEALAKERAEMSPQERRMQELGHLAEVNRKLTGRGADLDKLTEPGQKAVIKALHGEGGEKLLETIEREKRLAASGADLASVRSNFRPKAGLNLGHTAALAVTAPKAAAAQVGHHALRGLAEAAVNKISGGTTPRVANALADFLAMSPEDLASALEAHNAPKPLSRTMGKAAPVTAGAVNALSGFL